MGVACICRCSMRKPTKKIVSWAELQTISCCGDVVEPKSFGSVLWVPNSILGELQVHVDVDTDPSALPAGSALYLSGVGSVARRKEGT